jgi:hypothetical protein
MKEIVGTECESIPQTEIQVKKCNSIKKKQLFGAVQAK